MVKDLIRYKACVKLKKGVNIHDQPHSPIGLSARGVDLPPVKGIGPDLANEASPGKLPRMIRTGALSCCLGNQL